MKLYTIRIEGLPSGKKNALRPSGRGRKLHYDSGLRRALDACALQAQVQWAGKRALRHPHITMRASGYSLRVDRDNMLTVCLDVLVKAGILVDDRASECNGWLHIAPLADGVEPRVEITLEERLA